MRVAARLAAWLARALWTRPKAAVAAAVLNTLCHMADSSEKTPPRSRQSRCPSRTSSDQVRFGSTTRLRVVDAQVLQDRRVQVVDFRSRICTAEDESREPTACVYTARLWPRADDGAQPGERLCRGMTLIG